MLAPHDVDFHLQSMVQDDHQKSGDLLKRRAEEIGWILTCFPDRGTNCSGSTSPIKDLEQMMEF